MNVSNLETIAQKYLKEGFIGSQELLNLKNEFVAEIFGSHIRFEQLSISQQSKIEDAVRELLDGSWGSESLALVEDIVENLKHTTSEATFDPAGFSLPIKQNKDPDAPQKIDSLRFRTRELIQQLLDSEYEAKHRMAHKMLSKMVQDFPKAPLSHQKETLDIVFSLGAYEHQDPLFEWLIGHPEVIASHLLDFSENFNAAQMEAFENAVLLSIITALNAPQFMKTVRELLIPVDSHSIMTLYNQVSELLLSALFQTKEVPLIQTWMGLHFFHIPARDQCEILLYIKETEHHALLRAYCSELPQNPHPEMLYRLRHIAQGSLSSEQTRLHQKQAKLILSILDGKGISEKEGESPVAPFEMALKPIQNTFDYSKAQALAQDIIQKLSLLYPLIYPQTKHMISEKNGLSIWPKFELAISSIIEFQGDPSSAAPELFSNASDKMDHLIARKSLESLGSLVVSLEETTLMAAETLFKTRQALIHIQTLEKNLSELKSMISEKTISAQEKTHLQGLIRSYQTKLKYLLSIKPNLKKAMIMMKKRFPPKIDESIQYTKKSIQKITTSHAIHRRRETMMSFGHKIYEPLKPGFQLAVKSIEQYEKVFF